MAGLALLFALAALTVKQDGTELRPSCEPGEPVLAILPAGTPATVRFVVNGCYAVEVLDHGQPRRGYLLGTQLDGKEAWERARRNAPSVDAPANSQVPGYQEKSEGRSPWALLQDNRPAEALAAAERYLALTPRDPQLLALAGLAAHRNDMGVRAIGYWKDSLAIRPDPKIQGLLDQALREQESDRTGEPLHSPRFVFAL